MHAIGKSAVNRLPTLCARSDSPDANTPGHRYCRVARSSASPSRALVSQPRLLLLDEPLGALDALTRIEMQELIERVWQEKGFTAVVVTHDVSEAVALADRILMLDDGAVRLDVAVDLPRPRRRGDREAAAIECRILQQLLRR